VNRRDFQSLTRVRLVEAKHLLDAGLYDGAYYLAGYAVECALKACIAGQTQIHDFPPKPAEVRGMYTHNLRELVISAGLREDLEDAINGCKVFERYWYTVRDWSEETRYVRTAGPAAVGLYTAITDRQHGVLRWLRRHW
jgi:HEPN domain-containing protein